LPKSELLLKRGKRELENASGVGSCDFAALRCSRKLEACATLPVTGMPESQAGTVVTALSETEKVQTAWRDWGAGTVGLCSFPHSCSPHRVPEPYLDRGQCRPDASEFQISLGGPLLTSLIRCTDRRIPFYFLPFSEKQSKSVSQDVARSSSKRRRRGRKIAWGLGPKNLGSLLPNSSSERAQEFRFLSTPTGPLL